MPDRKHPSTSKGTIAHTILECLLKSRRKNYVDVIINSIQGYSYDKWTILPINYLIVKLLKKDNYYSPQAVKEIKEWVATALTYDFYCKGSEKLESEVNFELTGKNYLVRGYIDKLITLPDGNIKIQDYKSSKSKFSAKDLSWDVQSLIYSYAIYRIYGKIPEFEYIFLRYKKSPSCKPPKYNADQIEAIDDYLEGVAEQMSNFTYEDSISRYAFDNVETFRLCGKVQGGVKANGDPVWQCPFLLPFVYYEVWEGDKLLYSTRYEDEIKLKGNQEVITRQYMGCSRFFPENYQ